MSNKQVKSNIKALLEKHNIEQKELAEMTGLSVRTVSELTNNKTKRYPKSVIEAIANALEISDINEIISIVDKPQ